MPTKRKTAEKASGPEKRRATRPDDKRPMEIEPGAHPAVALQRAQALPASHLSPGYILTLQRTIGNRAVQHWLASQAASQPTPAIQRKCDEDEPAQRKSLASSITPLVQRQAEADEDEQEVQTKRGGAGGGFQASGEFESRLEASRGQGSRLPERLRSDFEQSFGADFHNVRVHTGDEPDRLNRSLQSRAFTRGQDLFFKRGEYNPGTKAGRKLIAHELTHVLQQTGGIDRGIGRQSNKLSRSGEPRIQRVLSVKETEEKAEKEKEIEKLNGLIEVKKASKTAPQAVIDKEMEEKKDGFRVRIRTPQAEIKKLETEISMLDFQVRELNKRLAALKLKEDAPSPEEEAKKLRETKIERKRVDREQAEKKAKNLEEWKEIIDEGKQAAVIVEPIRSAALKGLKNRLKRHDESVGHLPAYELYRVRAEADGLLDDEDVKDIKAVDISLHKASEEAESAKKKIEGIDHRTSKEETEGYRDKAKEAVIKAQQQRGKARAIPKRIEYKNRLDSLATNDEYKKAAKSIKFKYTGKEQLTLDRTYTTTTDGLGWGSEYKPQLATNWIIHTHRRSDGKLTKVHTKDGPASTNRADIPIADNKGLTNLGVAETDLSAGNAFEKAGRTFHGARAEAELKNHREGK